MARNPLAEVFGYPSTNDSPDSLRHRAYKLCPYNNKTAHCTKVSIDDPLGVCSVHHKQNAVITCPIRFRQDWLVALHAAEFFFPPGTEWERLSEVRLGDEVGKTAGNIDVVLAAYDERHQVIDFGALEVQAVYISGNVRDPFRAFMAEPTPDFDWVGRPKYPRPDYLSSSRKRLEPQLRYKGSILRNWGKKQAVAIQQSFYEHTLLRITTPDIGAMDTFVGKLQSKLSAKLAGLEEVDEAAPTAI